LEGKGRRGEIGAIAAEAMDTFKAEAKERMREGGTLAGRGRPKTDRVMSESAEPYPPPVSNQLKGPVRDIASKGTRGF
jgi:hypothetical protein